MQQIHRFYSFLLSVICCNSHVSNKSGINYSEVVCFKIQLSKTLRSVQNNFEWRSQMRIKAILRCTCAEIEEIHQHCDTVWKSALWFFKKRKQLQWSWTSPCLKTPFKIKQNREYEALIKHFHKGRKILRDFEVLISQFHKSCGKMGSRHIGINHLPGFGQNIALGFGDMPLQHLHSLCL